MACGYYDFPKDRIHRGLNGGSRYSDRLPLVVNCTGQMETDAPFLTDNVYGREDYYLLYMLRGEMTLLEESGEQELTVGCAVLFAPHYRYRYRYEGKEPLSYLWVHFTGFYAQRFLEECGITVCPWVLRTGGDSRISSLFLQMFELFKQEGSLVRQKRGCVLERILLTLADAAIPESDEQCLQTSLRYIHSSYAKRIRIPSLAAMEHLSNSRYTDLFRQKMGVSPVAYLNRLRLRVAYDLIQNTDMPVKQVGESVGYPDPQFFSKRFKREFGCPPTQLRNREK